MCLSRGPPAVKGGHGALLCTWRCDPWPGRRQGGASREGAGQGAGPGAGVRGRRPTGLRGAGLWLCVRSGRGGDSVVSASGIPYLGDQGVPGWGCWEHGARLPSLPV